MLGHNGAGKSTSLKMISGDTKLTAGQVGGILFDKLSSHLQALPAASVTEEVFKRTWKST